VAHELTIGDVGASSGLAWRYGNTFTAVPAELPYRPPRATPRPSVRGTQTAKVVGSGGEGQIDVDADGCVLLQFPWDRGDGKDGKSKHRVHVASVWAGTQWGFVQLPRIGQEVLVEFLEGDPDRPIVTGRVYNSANKPPYALVANKTQSGWKSRTVGGGADNFNELRFEDKQGEEHVYLQAEKDLQVHVKNDETRTVLHDRTTTIKNADTRTVEEGDDTHTVKKGKQTVEVSQGDQEVTVAVGKQKITVNGDQTLVVQTGNRSASVDTGNDQLTVKVGNLTIGVKLGNISIKADVGSITLEALQGITLKCGPTSSVKLTPAGVEVKGAMVTVEGQAQAQVKAAMVQVQGTAMTQVKAPMVQVNGDALLMAKGAVTMIG
jgi:type VI secretion system secreted protein VgrG